MKRLGFSLLGIVVMASALFGAACSTSGDADTSTPAPEASVARLVGPDEFAERISEPGVVIINVHVPDEGNIAGTDLVIPFDQITDSGDLPADLATPLAVYCRSDNMSADAVRDLEAMGYSDIVELDGGFNAWTASGRPLEPPSLER